MKQSDYAIHRPLNEFSFNFTDWDEKLDEIVAAIPSDAIWDDIHSVWLNKAKPLLADYNSINRWQEPVEFYGRVAKKFGLKRMLRPDGGVAVVTDEGYRGEMFGNEKLAKQLNDKCLLPPNLAAKFGITPKDCSKAEEPELEPEPEEKPKAELPIVQRPAEDDTTTVSATTTASEPVADRAEDDGCPQFFMARSGLKFQIYLSEPNKETGDPYFDKEFSFDEARKIVSGLNNNIDCSISSDEAVSNAISAVPALLAAGLVGRKNRPQGGKLKPEGGKNQLKPEGGKTRLHQGTSWNYDPNAEREVRNRQRLRAAQGRRSFTPDDLANQKTRMSNATRNRARAGRGRANPEEINRRTQDFDTRQKQRARYDTRSGRNRSSNPEEITRRDQDITKRRLQQKWAKADPSQFRQRPKTNTPTKTASASTPKSFVNEPDPAANNWKKHKVGDRVRRTPVSRKAQNFLKKPNENPFSKFDDTSASKNTPIKFDDKSPGRSTVRNIGSHGADTLHPEERVSKRSVPDPAKQGQNFLKKPDENPFSKFDDTSASKNTPIKFDDKPPGRSTVEPDRAKQGRDFLKRQPENPFSRFDDTPASKNTPIKWDDNGPGTSTVKKPKSPPVPPTPEPNSLMSRPVPTGGDPPEIKNDGPLQIPQNQKPDNPPPVDPPKLRNPERFGKLEIDLTTKDPLKTLQGIDVNDMPNLPEIKYNQLHNNLIRMLDTAADPPGGSLQNYLDNLKRDLLSRGVNAQALDTMTDLSKLYVKKLNIGKLGSTEISDLKHLTAALMSNNSSYSKWLDSLKDVKIDMETGLPKANANGDLTPANKGSKASEMPSSVKDIDKWKKSGNSFTPTTLEDFLKSQKITKNTIPFELLDPDAVKTSTLLDAFGFPKDTRLASTLTTDAASEALEKLAIGKLPVQNFPLEAIEGSASMWKDKKTLRQFTSAFQGSTLDLDKLDRAIAYAMTIKPEIDKLPPKETTYNDPFDKLENSLDNDATAKAIRDRAQRQLQDIEAEMNAAEEETNAERRAAKKAEIDAKLEKQRADARAALEAEESKLTDAQRKAHEAHIEAIDKLKAQQAISDRMAANQPTNRKVPGGEFGSSYEASLSAAQNAEIAKKQEQLVAMRKHEQALTKLMQDAEASSMQAYEEYKKTIAAEQTAREKYIKDIQEIGAKGREEAAMARRKAAYENEMLKIQADTNKAAEAYWQSVQNSPNSENLQRSVEKEMRDAKTFPGTTATAPDGTKSAAQTTQANQNFSDIQQQKLAEPDPPPKFNGPKQLTPEPSTPAAEIEAQAEKIRNMSNQSPPSSTQTKKTVGDKRMVNGDEYEWLGKQWRNNTTGKMATTAAAQQLNSMSIPGSSPMVGTTQGALNKADIEQQAQSMNGPPGEVNTNDVTSDKAGTQAEMPTTRQGDMDPGPSTVPQSAEEMRPNDTNLDAVPNADHNKMDELVEDSELKNEQLKALDKDVPHGLIDTKTEEKLLAQIDELEQAVKDGKVDKSVLDQAKALQEELQKYEMATPASADDTPIPDKQRRSVTLEFQNKLDTFMDDVAEMSADKFTKRNTLKSTSTGVTPNEIKKNMPESLRNLADTLGLDTVEELKALQDQHDPKSIDKRYNALKNKMMKQMENILTDNVEGSETKRVTQQKLQEYIDANGGTVKAAATSAVEQMKDLAPNQLTGMAEKLAGKALATRLLKGAGKLAVVGVAGAATGGLAIVAQALNIFEWALDGYDIVTILIGTGVMDDPNEVLNHARAEDLKKVDEFMKSDADDEDKKAFVAAMLRYDSVPAWNPKWWFGGLESWNSELFDKIGYDNKWHDTNFVDEWGQTEGVTVSSSSINPKTSKPEIREEGITPYNIHKLRVGVDVSKAARTRGDMERFVDRVESIYESWTQGPFVWLAPVDDNKFQMIVASSVKDVRDATSLDDLRGVNQLVTVPIDHGDGRPRMTEQLKFIPGTFENNLQREIRKYISGGGHFLKDNMEEVLQHITDPNDRRAFDKIINGSVNEIVPVTLQVAQYQAEQAERKWTRVKRINWRETSQFPKQRADALLLRYNRDIGLGKYETKESINRRLKIIRKMKHLTERLQTYRNAKYFIIGS